MAGYCVCNEKSINFGEWFSPPQLNCETDGFEARFSCHGMVFTAI